VHCEVILGSQTLVRDLGSTNGTVVDGVRVVEGILKEGSIIRIGDTTLTYTSR
jgi:pSer/pThr/pTyr-binding forkhead associated (FHA) protein